MTARLPLACLCLLAIASPVLKASPVSAASPASDAPRAPTPQAPAPAPTKAEIAKTAPVAVEEPRDIVAQIYKLAATSLAKSGASPFFEPAVRQKYFSKSFDLLVTSAETRAAHDHDQFIDFDPISASQDAELKKVTLKTDLLDIAKAVVSASFSNYGQPTVVTYDFIKTGGVWQIDDIKGTTEKEAWSVRKILTASGKPPTELPGQPGAGKAPDAATKAPKASAGSAGKTSAGAAGKP